MDGKIKRPLFDNYDEIRKEQVRMSKRLEETAEIFEDTKTGKDDLIKLLSGFIKCTGGEITVCRTDDNGRVLVNQSGVALIKYRHKSPNLIRKIDEIIDLLKVYWLDFNAIKDDEVIKRIECFLVAVKKLPQLADAYAKFTSIKQQVGLQKKVKVIGANYGGDDYQMESHTIQKILFHEDHIELDFKDDTQDFNPLKLEDWFTIEQFKEIVFESFVTLETDLKASMGAMKKAISDIKKDLAPITMLENC